MRLLLAGLSILAGAAQGAPDEALLGKAEGYPRCPWEQVRKGDQKCLVYLYTHYDEFVPAHSVAKGAVARPLKRAGSEPDAVDFNAFLDHSRNLGLLVMKGDTILVERYQYGRKADQRFISHSMAKTVLAMLVGIAVAEKSIASIDDLAERYVPGLKGHPYGATSLRHLLTMSSGVKFREDYDGTDDLSVLFEKTFLQKGPGGVDTVASFRERSSAPGARFRYASAETEVLGLVLRAAVGKPLAEYLSEKIWQPMGAEADATWLIDAGGYELGYAGINATLRDWGRFGLLLAENGAWNGRQIIPAEWVKAATNPDSAHLRPGYATGFLGYGYQTWIVPGVRQTYALLGVRGQAVFVDPVAKLVVVHTAVHARPRDPARDQQYSMWNALLRTYSQ